MMFEGSQMHVQKQYYGTRHPRVGEDFLLWKTKNEEFTICTLDGGIALSYILL